MEQRPDPDKLLAHIQAEEQWQARGKLKIFLGYAAGVGKTFAMLEAAHQRQVEGVDLVVAYVETHGRVETEAMVRSLEVILRKQVEYRGILLPEMDVDAVLVRHPQLALVDELAHTNAPGSRHLKRYQDVEELLANGIDVYTTLNIQHLESLNDVVAQITGVIVRETLPDLVIDETTELELIDLPPAELLRRLEEGKVYVPDQAARAIRKFFRPGNLTALRELTMRRAAERVDDQMRAYMQSHAIPGPWPAKEKLLVCVGPGFLSERLVRAARRLAQESDAEWVALYVETHRHVRLTAVEKEHIARALLLAEELGGKAVTLPGHKVAPTVLDYARSHNVTKIVVGKLLRSHWQELIQGPVVDQIIRASGTIAVYVISGTAEARKGFPPETAMQPSRRSWLRYVQGALLVAAGAGLSALLYPLFAPANLVMIYLLVVVIAAIALGRGPSLQAAVLSVLVFDFFFVPPRFALAVSDTEYLLTFAALLAVGLIISNLTAQVREQAEAAQRREIRTIELYALSRDLAAAANLDEIVQHILVHASQTFGREVAVLMPDAARCTVASYAPNSDLTLNENELAVATWVFQHGQPAGRGTDTLPAAGARYLPLKTARGVVGVLGVTPADLASRLSPDQRHLLEAFASQAALAIERAQLAEQAQRAEMLQATERLQTALLNSISHDLRTPLVSITGALSSLQEEGIELDLTARRSLVENAREEAERLNRIVGNLLDMTRIEAGALKLTRELCDVQDVVSAALESLDDRLRDRPLAVRTPPDLLAPMDFVLIVQVLVNLLDNALKYSASGTPIEVLARVDGAEVIIEVADRGIGIPPDDLERVFDKFYRVQRPGQVGGTGLGLSICKGIVEAHAGRIWVQNREDGGTVVTVVLPLHLADEGVL